MNRHRAMTLIEMVVCLALLAMMTTVAVSWMTASLKAQSREQEQTSWIRSSHALLDLIGNDLVTVDRLDTGGRQRSPRVVVDEHSIQIRTRSDGNAGTHVYSLNAQLSQVNRLGTQSDLVGNEPPLLGQVERFTAVIELPSETHVLPSLRVVLVGTAGERIERIYVLGRGDVE
jgi:prepilin-type N-terminal cleavage/methylation domain-containing protein